MEQPRGSIAPITAQYRMRGFDLIDVTPETVKALLQRARSGRLEDQEVLFRKMFDSWPRLVKNISEVGKAVSRLEWTVMPYAEKGEDPTPEAQKMADIVEKALWMAQPDPDKWETDFIGAIKCALDAYAMGHNVQQILWANNGEITYPRAYCPIPARFYGYPTWGPIENKPDQLLLYPEGLSYGKGQPFPKDEFIIAKWSRGSEHPVFSANLRSLAKWWLGAYFGWGWQLQYAQLFGVPWRTIEAEGAEAIEKAQAALEDIGAAGWAVLPKNTTLTIHDSVGSGESQPQRIVVQDADEACDVMFLGQTLTSGEGEHGTQALGTVHSSMRDDYLAAAGDWVASVFAAQLVRAIIRLNFGDEAAAGNIPFLVAKMPEAKDEKAEVARIEALLRMGIPLTQQYVHDSLGVPIAGEGDKLFVPVRSEQDPENPDPENPADQEDDEAEPVEAARRGMRGKKPSGPRLKLWPKRSGVISRK